MLKKCVVAIAVLMIFPAIAKAEDIFWSFSPTALETTATILLGETGSAYIFSDGNFSFGALDIQFSNTNSGVVSFSGGEAFNPTFNAIGGMRFDSSEITFAYDGSSGRLFSEAIIQNGVNPALSALFDPGYAPNVGPNGAVLLARVDFEVVGFGGDSDLEFVLGPQGAIDLPDISLDPRFGSATVITLVPICTGQILDNLGDLNYDGVVNFLDIAPFIEALATREYVFRADCNEDGRTNFLDITAFVNLL